MIAFKGKKIKNKLQKKIAHTFVDQYVQSPYININKIIALILIFNDIDQTEKDKEDLILSVILVQLALDTHDVVSNEITYESEFHETERQLTVLAGDYYSGLYYELLAKKGETNFIHILAQAIKYINEQKMTLYNHEINSWSNLLFVWRQIDHHLYLKVADHYGLSTEKSHYISELLYISRLYEELSHIHNKQHSYIKDYVNKKLVLPPEYTSELSIEKEILESKNKLQKLHTAVPYEYKEVKNIIFDKTILSTAEEG